MEYRCNVCLTDYRRWNRGKAKLEAWKTRLGNRTGTGEADTAERTVVSCDGYVRETRGNIGGFKYGH